ncbi:hypothetical protein K4K61_006208 [Colletotrichum sp. SAR11_59]|nr:hypothetical protein K4K61_006208 [Colletotrichum sp. SAR11_59]
MPRQTDLSHLSSLPSNISDEQYQAFVNANKELITNKFLLTRDDFDLRSTRSEPRGRLPGQPLNVATSLREVRRSAPTRRSVAAAPASKRTAGRRSTTYVNLVDEEEEGGEEEEEQEEEILEEEEEEEEELEQDVPETMVNKERVRVAIRNFVVSSESTARAEVEMRLALYEMLRHGVEDVDPEPEVVAGPSHHRPQATKSTPAKSTPAKSTPTKAKPKTTKKTVKSKGKGKMTARATRERDIDDLMNLF